MTVSRGEGLDNSWGREGFDSSWGRDGLDGSWRRRTRISASLTHWSTMAPAMRSGWGASGKVVTTHQGQGPQAHGEGLDSSWERGLDNSWGRWNKRNSSLGGGGGGTTSL